MLLNIINQSTHCIKTKKEVGKIVQRDNALKVIETIH